MMQHNTPHHESWMIWWMASDTSADSDRTDSFMATFLAMSMPKLSRTSTCAHTSRAATLGQQSNSNVANPAQQLPDCSTTASSASQ